MKYSHMFAFMSGCSLIGAMDNYLLSQWRPLLVNAGLTVIGGGLAVIVAHAEGLERK